MQIMARTTSLLFTAAALALLLAACSSNPVSGDRHFVMQSAAGEIRQGQRMHEELVESGMLYDDPELTAYVNEVGQRLAAASHRTDIEYHFHVIDDPTVNAFAFPGGYIYIARGLLPYLQTEDQLAAVLGHEVGHVAARHPTRLQTAGRTSNILSTAAAIFTGSGAIYQVGQAYGASVTSGYGREMELEADALGAEYLARAGYDPNAMLQVLHVLKDQELFAAEVRQQRSSYHGLYSSHPRNDQRLHEVVRNAGNTEGANSEYVEPVGDFLALIDGLPWGEAAADGVFRNTRYYHGRLGVVIDFPEGWQVRDSATALTAIPPNVRGAGMSVELRALEGRNSKPETFVTDVLGLPVAAGESIETDGLPGYLATLRQEEDQSRLRLAAVIFKDGRAFIFRGNNHDRSFDDQFVDAFSDTVGSFRRMQAADRSSATQHRVQMIVARPGDTYDSIARQLRMGRNGAEQLRLLNGQYPRGEPRAGDRIKILR